MTRSEIIERMENEWYEAPRPSEVVPHELMDNLMRLVELVDLAVTGPIDPPVKS